MSIYRGPGGPGDAVNDATSEATLTVQAKDAAIAAKVSAETAATNAAASATSATNSASSASSSASSASSSASAASTSASNASSSASAASTSASNASTSATNASNSASAASTSATNASNSATAASTSATNASNSASSASTSATNASNSATSAATSASDTATLYDNFDDRYLGAKSSAPSVDNDGNALITGALFFNSSTSLMKVWSGSAWLDAYASVSGAVTAVTGTAPIASTGGATPAISISQATTSTNGYLSSTDWNTFNNKQPALSAGYGDTTNPYASKTANYVLASPNGSAGSPTFRALVAADVPTLNQNTTGTASNVTGTVAIANGGTGQTAKAAAFNALSPVTTTGDLILGNGTNSSTRLAIGTNGYLLTSNGTTASWAAAPVSLPSQSGYAGKYLTTDGTTASWATVASGGSASNGIFQNATTVNTNETISSGNNGFSVGPMTIASGIAVTVASGQRWVVI